MLYVVPRALCRKDERQKTAALISVSPYPCGQASKARTASGATIAGRYVRKKVSPVSLASSTRLVKAAAPDLLPPVLLHPSSPKSIAPSASSKAQRLEAKTTFTT